MNSKSPPGAHITHRSALTNIVMNKRSGDADRVFKRGWRQFEFRAFHKHHGIGRQFLLLVGFLEMNCLLRIEIEPNFSLRILFEFLNHQLIAARTGRPVNTFHGVAMYILPNPGCMTCNFVSFSANDLAAGNYSWGGGDRPVLMDT